MSFIHFLAFLALTECRTFWRSAQLENLLAAAPGTGAAAVDISELSRKSRIPLVLAVT